MMKYMVCLGPALLLREIALGNIYIGCVRENGDASKRRQLEPLWNKLGEALKMQMNLLINFLFLKNSCLMKLQNKVRTCNKFYWILDNYTSQ